MISCDIIGGVTDMGEELNIKMYAFTLDCKDPHELAKFYAALLKWEIPFHDDEYVCLAAPGTNQGAYPCITFQRNPEYKPPVWPEEPEAQQQMAHIDLAVNDLEKAVQYAIDCGATIAGQQFSDGWRVMFDPAGHPFCLCQMKSIFESAHFALL
jgi:predicted enzyme related to lactoylglutathione lyase